jgi:hypothetical protein
MPSGIRDQIMRIYLTHCTAKKDESPKHTGEKVTRDRLYRGKFIKAFMRTCKLRGAQWAILSDLYGVWFPDTVHGWYEKHPNSVTDGQFWALARDLDEKLERYNEIWFYRNPGRFHPLYGRLLTATTVRDRVTLFSRVAEIV